MTCENHFVVEMQWIGDRTKTRTARMSRLRNMVRSGYNFKYMPFFRVFSLEFDFQLAVTGGRVNYRV